MTSAFSTIPGTPGLRFVLVGPRLGKLGFDSGDEATVRLDSSPADEKLLVRTDRNSDEHTELTFYGLKPAFLDRLAEARELQIGRGGKPRLRLQLPPSQAAVQALRRCVDQRLAEWGVDAAPSAALRERPQPLNSHEILRDSDYPLAASLSRASGTVVATVDVSARGRVVGCTIVASGGHSALDSATCRLWRERARYRPAVGTDGKPAEARTVAVARWILPS